MGSVSTRIKFLSQPPGGYLKLSDFQVIDLDDGFTPNEKENIPGSIVALVVDYLTRICLGTDSEKVFRVSLEGADIASLVKIESKSTAQEFLKEINGINRKSIINACKLVSFDVWDRNPFAALMTTGYEEINPDNATIENIQLFVSRNIEFFRRFGGVVKDGFNFDPVEKNEKAYNHMIETQKGTYGGYTPTISRGEGDFLTKDTLLDIRATRARISSKHTLKLLVYWIMGQHSGQEVFKNITRIGMFNSRSNKAYFYYMRNISENLIKTVEREVICYED